METDGYVAYVDETIAIDELVLEVLATDRDEGDAVRFVVECKIIHKNFVYKLLFPVMLFWVHTSTVYLV